MNTQPQRGILSGLPKHGRYLEFSAGELEDLKVCLQRLPSLIDGERAVVGLGATALEALGLQPPGIRAAPLQGPGDMKLQPMPTALWLWLRGNDRGQLLHQTLELTRMLAPGLVLQRVTDAFVHLGGRDLSGYEDGTENPVGHSARRAALMTAVDGPYRGSSWVAVQRWQHNFAALQRMSPHHRDQVMGRAIADNAELADAPTSSHVKRTAQERFEPPAFLLRRSMPWSEGSQAGLMFVAFGHRPDAFEAQWKAMTGREDGVVDALFEFTAPLAGGYFWCPPVVDGRIWWLGWRNGGGGCRSKAKGNQLAARPR